MLRIPHIRKHTPQSSRQTKRGVHKRVHVFHANVTHTTTIPANQARRSQTRPRIPRKRNTPQSSQQTKRGVHKRVHVFHANVTHTTTIPANQARRSQTRQPPPKRHTFKAPQRPIGTTFNPEQPQHTGTSQYPSARHSQAL